MSYTIAALWIKYNYAKDFSPHKVEYYRAMIAQYYKDNGLSIPVFQ